MAKRVKKNIAPLMDKSVTKRWLVFAVGLILIIIAFFWGWSFKIALASLQWNESKEATIYSNAQGELEKILGESGLARTENDQNQTKEIIISALEKIIADKQSPKGAE